MRHARKKAAVLSIEKSPVAAARSLPERSRSGGGARKSLETGRRGFGRPVVFKNKGDDTELDPLSGNLPQGKKMP